MDLTLKQRLHNANISTSRACELFGRTERTLWNWNKNPPNHVLEVIKLHGTRHTMPEGWHDWYFDREWIIDPAGNAYNQKDIFSSHWTAKAYESLTGSSNDIINLKNVLERRIIEAQKSPAITIKVTRGENIERFIIK